MDKQVIVLHGAKARQNAVVAIMSAPEDWKVEIKPKGRTRAQNSFSHAWYGEIASVLREDDAAGWKAYCKLHHGVPILRAEDDDFRAAYDKAIKGLTYEQKLAAMHILPVTSLMNVKQLTKYADAVRDDFYARGVHLTVKGQS